MRSVNGCPARPRRLPDASAIWASCTAQPVPDGSPDEPARKLPSRCTWYGLSRPIVNGAATAAPAKSGRRNRAGTRPITSIATVSTASSVLVLRSGCHRVSATAGNAKASASTKRCHGARLDASTCASTMRSPTLTISEGWKLNEPKASQRVAPFAATPTTRTAPSKATPTP